jgi:hypothetical protein
MVFCLQEQLPAALKSVALVTKREARLLFGSVQAQPCFFPDINPFFRSKIVFILRSLKTTRNNRSSPHNGPIKIFFFQSL